MKKDGGKSGMRTTGAIAVSMGWWAMVLAGDVLANGQEQAEEAQLAQLEQRQAGAGGEAEGKGLAARYPGDRNIASDPSVIFAEGFEESSMEALTARWESVKNPEIMSFSDDTPGEKRAGRSLLMTHIGGESTGGHLYRRLMPGYERVFARFYVKFHPDCAPVHHFGTCVGGNNPATPWPQVRAGEPPAGDKGFWAGIEPFGKSWTWDYYTYWYEMRGSPPRGQTWGNSFVHDPDLKVARGRWVCIEMMVKMNAPGERDGEMALWIDGDKVSHLGPGYPKGKWVFDKFLPGRGGESVRWNRETGEREHFRTEAGGEPFEGFGWRTSDELSINFVWAYLYITGAPDGHESKVWFDDIVVATEYIGPMR